MSEGDLLNLQCLVGNYLNGFKIVSIEKDPFIKGQINLFTDSTEDIGFGDRNVIKFYVRDEKSNVSICREQINKDIYILTEFEKWLEKEILKETPNAKWFDKEKYEEVENADNLKLEPKYVVFKQCLEKLQELKGDKNE